MPDKTETKKITPQQLMALYQQAQDQLTVLEQQRGAADNRSVQIGSQLIAAERQNKQLAERVVALELELASLAPAKSKPAKSKSAKPKSKPAMRRAKKANGAASTNEAHPPDLAA